MHLNAEGAVLGTGAASVVAISSDLSHVPLFDVVRTAWGYVYTYADIADVVAVAVGVAVIINLLPRIWAVVRSVGRAVANAWRWATGGFQDV